jgi:hypothetical protein
LLNQLVKEHHQLYQAVPEYQSDSNDDRGVPGLMKPKNHAALHLGQAIGDVGPIRGVWCFAFECLNQRFKRIAERTNYKEVCRSVATFWSLQSAIELGSAAVQAFGFDDCVVLQVC